jgi:ABC-2 type transport system permease protein
MTFIASLRKEFIEQWRTYRFLVLVIVLAFFGMTSPVLAKYTPELLKIIPATGGITIAMPPPTVMDATSQYVKNVSQFGILLALLLSMGAVAQEKEKGTAAMMLVKPLSRPTFILSKVAALGLAFLASLLIAGLGAYYYTVILFQPVDLGAWLAMNLLLWVYMLVYVAITVLFSTLTRSQAAAAGLSFGILLLLGLVGSLGKLGEYLPAQLINWSVSLMAGLPVTYWPALAVSLGLVLACVAVALISFRKQEL